MKILYKVWIKDQQDCIGEFLFDNYDAIEEWLEDNFSKDFNFSVNICSIEFISNVTSSLIIDRLK